MVPGPARSHNNPMKSAGRNTRGPRILIAVGDTRPETATCATELKRTLKRWGKVATFLLNPVGAWPRWDATALKKSSAAFREKKGQDIKVVAAIGDPAALWPLLLVAHRTGAMTLLFQADPAKQRAKGISKREAVNGVRREAATAFADTVITGPSNPRNLQRINKLFVRWTR